MPILKVVGVKKGFQVRLKYTNHNGTPIECVVTKFFSKDDIHKLHDKPAEFELNNGQIQRIRLAGEKWRERLTPASVNGPTETSMPSFYNPYNFIPALPRGVIPEGNGLKDGAPLGHHAYHADHWTGSIRVKMTTVTPLLLPDAAQMKECSTSKHKSYPVRVDGDGRPLVASTSVKGMLRTAFETVTNSRMGVFVGHEERLALRMAARDGSRLVPARIENTAGRLMVRLLADDALMRDDGSPDGNPPLAYAAWLHRYRKNVDRDPIPPQTIPSPPPKDKLESTEAIRDPSGYLPQHRQEVWVRISGSRPHRSGRFAYCCVTDIQPSIPGGALPGGWRRGWVCVTGANIRNKHEERVFLEPVTPIAPVLLSNGVKKKWETLIANYQKLHQKELAERKAKGQSPQDYLGQDPGKTAWSRHVYTQQDLVLDDGALCYASARRVGGTWDILALYPVMISRDLYGQTPADLLCGSLHPARRLQELSPADRVFGWVNQTPEEKGSFKGQLWVGPVTCDVTAEKGICTIPGGFPLAILGQPKPEHVRFYGASDKRGTPLGNGTAKKEGYKDQQQGLRGRKVYPHQPRLTSSLLGCCGKRSTHWKRPPRGLS